MALDTNLQEAEPATYLRRLLFWKKTKYLRDVKGCF